MFLDPATRHLSENQSIFWNKLDQLINHLTFPRKKIELAQRSPRHQPVQLNNFDCGPFVCQFALDLVNLKMRPCPDAYRIRKSIDETINGILKNKISTLISGNSTTHPLLLETLTLFNSSSPDFSNILAYGPRAIQAIYPDKFKKKIVTPTSLALRPPLSAYMLRCKFATEPKKNFQSLLPDLKLTSLPTPEEFERHFAKEAPPPLDPEFVLTTPFYEDKLTEGRITTDEVKHAFTICHNSAPGYDGLVYTGWTDIDPNFIFLTSYFNQILDTCKVPDQWKSFKTTLLVKPGKAAHSHLTASWRPIAIMDTSYRIFATIMNNRLLRWVKAGKLISKDQKASYVQMNMLNIIR